MSKTLFAASLLLGVASLVVSGCKIYQAPHGPQNTPPVVRVNSVPPGATISYVHPTLGGNFQVGTGKDLPALLVKHRTEVTISKEGFVPWQGRLRDLTQVAIGTYLVELRPVAPTE